MKRFCRNPVCASPPLKSFTVWLANSNILQQQPDTKTQRKIRGQYPNARIPEPSHAECYSQRARLSYQERYHIALRARDIHTEKEPRQSRLIKEDIFNNLIDSARSAEWQNKFRAKEDLERIRVYASFQRRVKALPIGALFLLADAREGKMKIPGFTVSGFWQDEEEEGEEEELDCEEGEDEKDVDDDLSADDIDNWTVRPKKSGQCHPVGSF